MPWNESTKMDCLGGVNHVIGTYLAFLVGPPGLEPGTKGFRFV